MNDLSPDVYFGALPTDRIGAALRDKCESYWNYLSTSGRLDLYRRAYYYYYRADYDLGRIAVAGMNGEYQVLSVNHFKNLVDHVYNLITSQKFSYQPKAVNSDHKSLAASILSKGILEYFDAEKRVARDRKRATRFALLFGEGYLSQDWDTDLGEEAGVLPDGSIRKSGDVRIDAHLPTDVIFDYTATNAKKNWTIERRYQNKYDLMAKYPELADKIQSIKREYDDKTDLRIVTAADLASSDLIPVFTFRHGKTPVLPEGRLVIYLDESTVLMDTPLPYKKDTGMYRVAVEDQEDSAFGYTHLWHLMSLQEQLDNLVSTVATNQTLGVANLFVPQGSNMQHEKLAEGMNVFTYNPQNAGKPEVLNLVNTPKEVFEMMTFLITQMETIAGVNSVVRGEVPTNLRSGSALALVASQAIQFSSGLQESYVHLIEDSATGEIRLLQQFASEPRMQLIVGKVNQPLLKQFVGQDLEPIDRVLIELANPLAATTAGRVQLAETLIQNGIINQANKQQYINVLQTGALEPEIEGAQAELLLVKEENEALAQGIPVTPVKTDNHPLHILEHKAVLSSLEARRDPAVVQATLAHIQEHAQLQLMMQMTEPLFLQILGIPPSPMPIVPPAQPGSPEAETPEMAAGTVGDAKMPSLPQGSPPSSQQAYEQMGGAQNPNNNAKAK